MWRLAVLTTAALVIAACHGPRSTETELSVPAQSPGSAPSIAASAVANVDGPPETHPYAEPTFEQWHETSRRAFLTLMPFARAGEAWALAILHSNYRKYQISSVDRADIVKVFPADLGGPDYIKTLKEPVPQVELLPTKGIDLQTAGAYIKAGAAAVGAGSALVSKALIAAGDHARITANAEQFIRVVREARGA